MAVSRRNPKRTCLHPPPLVITEDTCFDDFRFESLCKVKDVEVRGMPRARISKKAFFVLLGLELRSVALFCKLEDPLRLVTSFHRPRELIVHVADSGLTTWYIVGPERIVFVSPRVADAHRRPLERETREIIVHNQHGMPTMEDTIWPRADWATYLGPVRSRHRDARLLPTQSIHDPGLVGVLPCVDREAVCQVLVRAQETLQAIIDFFPVVGVPELIEAAVSRATVGAVSRHLARRND
jgi:hypothetical protein